MMKLDFKKYNFGKFPNTWAIVLIGLIACLYIYNLTGWMIFDDEGEYLYQVWRMTLGEVPYQDFLTPQLPVFLYMGTGVMKLFGNSLLVMRLYSVLLALGIGFLLYIAGRKHKNSLTGLIAMVLFLAHEDVFRELRIFRNEPLFLFLVTAGILSATWSTGKRQKLFLAGAGISFGLATLVKLFGLLPFGGIGLWLIWSWWRDKRPFIQLVQNMAALGLPLIILLIVIGGGFNFIVPEFLDLVVGHHLAQGSQLSIAEIINEKLKLFGEYLSFYPVLVPVALFSGIQGLKKGDNRQRLVWQFVTVLSFVLLSRQLGRRHFIYLVPTISLMAAWVLAAGLNGRYAYWGRVGAVIAIVGILYPAAKENSFRAGWIDTVTQPILTIIEDQTDAEDFILVDDIGLAYYAKRPTTYSGAALSNGAMTSWQITEDILIDEIIQDDVRLVIIDESLLTGNHIVFLRDYPKFYRFLENNFDMYGRFRRDFQELAVWRRDGSRPLDTSDTIHIQYRDGTQFGESMELVGYSFSDQISSPGDTLSFTIFWTADFPADRFWSVYTHLVDPNGEIVGQADKAPYDGLFPTTRWQSGHIVDDRFAITIPEDAINGEYRIAVGMYDWQTGERLPLFSEEDPIQDNRLFLSEYVTVQE